MDGITDSLDQLKLGTESDGRLKLRSWLGKFLKFVITDERIIVGLFVCTDKDGNVILENSWEYTETIDDNDEPRFLALSMIPGKHIKSVAVMIS